MNRTPSQRLVAHKLKAAGRVARATARKATNQKRNAAYKSRRPEHNQRARERGRPIARKRMSALLPRLFSIGESQR